MMLASRVQRSQGFERLQSHMRRSRQLPEASNSEKEIYSCLCSLKKTSNTIDSNSVTVYNSSMEDSEHHYSIEDLAELVNLSIRTIRYYISEGLLPGPGARGKAAIYGEEHLLRLRLIRLLSGQHVPLVEMRDWLLRLSLNEIRALLVEEEERTALYEQAKEASSPQEYMARLLRNAREARQAPQPPAQRSIQPLLSQLVYKPAPRQQNVKRIQEKPLESDMPTPLVGASLPAAEPERWQRWELAPGIELHIRAESEHQHRGLLERLFQAAGNVYPPSSNQ
jgi:DNA-binding transcriptional MerR regulator